MWAHGVQIGTMFSNKSEAEWQLAQQLVDDWESSQTRCVEDKEGRTYKYKESLDSAAFALKVLSPTHVRCSDPWYIRRLQALT